MSATTKWHAEPVVAFDTETTSPDPATARIVTAAVVHMHSGQRPKPVRWIIDPGVDIPTEASDIHGYTNARIHQLLAEQGGRPGQAIRFLPTGAVNVLPAEAAVFEIAMHLGGVIAREQAVIVHNAAYDLTLLEHEAVRYDVDPLTARPGGVRGVVDPMVIEKAYDPYRKSCYKKGPDGPCDVENRVHVCGGCRGGKHQCGGCGSTDRTLTSLCAHYGVVLTSAHYGVVLTSAHDAAADAIASVRLLGKLIAGWPQMASWKLPTLYAHQETWRAEQQTGLREFFEKVGKDHDGMCPVWPVHTPACAAAHRTQVAA